MPIWMASPFVRAGLVAAAVLVVFCTGYFKGSAHVQSKFDEYRAEVSAAGLAQKQNTERVTQSQKQVTAKSEADYEANRNAIRAVYQRMRQQSRVSALSGVPGASQKPYGTASDELSAAPILAERCAEATQQLISLQTWITEQQNVR